MLYRLSTTINHSLQAEYLSVSKWQASAPVVWLACQTHTVLVPSENFKFNLFRVWQLKKKINFSIMYPNVTFFFFSSFKWDPWVLAGFILYFFITFGILGAFKFICLEICISSFSLSLYDRDITYPQSLGIDWFVFSIFVCFLNFYESSLGIFKKK